jgi:mono/diheme cytochrome c family protein
MPLRILAAALAIAAALAQPPMPEQAARGKKLFAESNRGISCATCHQLEKIGTDAGPDLTALGALSPRAIAMAVRSSRTAYVQEITLSTGARFPGFPKGTDGNRRVFWDLSQTPPAERKLAPEQIKSVKDNAGWKHPPGSSGLPAEDLAAIAAYLRWVASGATSPVAPADVQP